MAGLVTQLDKLDIDIIAALVEHPRAGELQLSRLLGVARGTVQARMQRLEEGGIITGYSPDIDLGAAGYPVQALVTLEIAQGALVEVTKHLEVIPEVLEAYATTGSGDVVCRIASRSHQDLQVALLRLNRSAHVTRSTSVIVLSVVVPYRVLPLLREKPLSAPGRSPVYRLSKTPPKPHSSNTIPSLPGEALADTQVVT